MAIAMNINPDSKEYIPFISTSKHFTENFFNIVLSERIKEGKREFLIYLLNFSSIYQHKGLIFGG